MIHQHKIINIFKQTLENCKTANYKPALHTNNRDKSQKEQLAQ